MSSYNNIIEKLGKLQTIKSDIKTSILNKGVDVNDDITTYAAAIDSIVVSQGKNYLYLKNDTTSTMNVSIYNSSGASSAVPSTLSYSFDLVTWTTWDGTIAVGVADKIYLKANDGFWSTSSGSLQIKVVWLDGTDGTYSVGGNPKSLISYDIDVNLPAHSFENMFAGEPVSNISQLELNTYNLLDNVYFAMFNKCTKLTTCFDNITLGDVGAYSLYQMFFQCTSLKSAPKITIKGTVQEYGLFSMFENCSSLEKLVLDDQEATLNTVSYGCLCQNCSSLKVFITYIKKFNSFAQSCLYDLLGNCPNLTYVRVMLEDLTNTGLEDNWLSGGGSFYCPLALTDPKVSSSWIVYRNEINTVILSQSEYDSLTSIDPNIIYIIK